MITCENISKTFRNQEVLRPFSIEFKEGEVVALLGPNGAGKTTFLEILCGTRPPSTGRILIDEVCMKEYPQDAKSRIGNSPQGPSFFPHLTGRENLSLMAALRWSPGAQLGEESDLLLEAFGLKNDCDRPAREYSEGMSQKLSIAMALLGSPRHLILDESLNGLDPASLVVAKRYIKQHARNGGLVLMTTHILSLVEDLADRVVLLSEGQIQQNQRLDDLRAANSGAGFLEAYYLEWTAGRDQ